MKNKPITSESDEKLDNWLVLDTTDTYWVPYRPESYIYEKTLKQIPINEIEKYLRKEKLKNIRKC